MANLQSLLVKLGIDADDFSGGLARATKSLRRFRDDVEKSSRGIETFGNALSSIGRPAAFGALAAGATNLAASIAPAAGALGLIPGVAATAGAAIGTLSVAMTGFGEAMSNLRDPAKFAEAIAKLSPAAAQAATAVRGLVPAWDGLTNSVQQAAFAGVAEQIKTLGGKYIPILEAGMTGIATQFNRAAMSVADFLSSSQAVARLKTILTGTKTVVGNLADAAAPLMAAFMDIAAVGSRVFASLTSGAGQAAQRFADFIAQARRTGKLEEWIRGGVAVLKKLGTIATNVGSILSSIFKAAGASGGSLLDTLVRLTSQFAAWASSAQGQKKLNQIFSALDAILVSMATILPILATGISTLAGWFAMLPAPVQTVLTGFLGISTVVGLLTKKFAPLIAVLGKLTTKLVTSATTQGAALNRMIKGLNRFGAALGRGIGKVGAFAGKTAASFGRMAATAIAKTTAMVASVTAKFAAMATKAIASMAKTAARVVAKWVVMAAGAMARAAIMAAAWVVAMGPVGWVTAAIIALVALIIANWDKVKKWTTDIWNAVVGFIKDAWNWIVDTVTGAAQAVWNAIKTAFNSAVDAVSNAISNVIDFVAALPGRIISAIGNLASLLWNAGVDLVQGLINGIGNMANAVYNKFLGIVKGAWNSILGFLGISSPSKEATWAGAMVGEGLVRGIGDMVRDVEKAALKLSQAAMIDVSQPAIHAERGVAVPGMSEALSDGSWSTAGTGPAVQMNVYNPVAERASDTLQRRMRNIAELGLFAGEGAAA